MRTLLVRFHTQVFLRFLLCSLFPIIGSNTLLNIHTLNSSDANGKHMAIRQIEHDLASSFAVAQVDDEPDAF